MCLLFSCTPNTCTPSLVLNTTHGCTFQQTHTHARTTCMHVYPNHTHARAHTHTHTHTHNIRTLNMDVQISVVYAERLQQLADHSSIHVCVQAASNIFIKIGTEAFFSTHFYPVCVCVCVCVCVYVCVCVCVCLDFNQWFMEQSVVLYFWGLNSVQV